MRNGLTLPFRWDCPRNKDSREQDTDNSASGVGGRVIAHVQSPVAVDKGARGSNAVVGIRGRVRPSP